MRFPIILSAALGAAALTAGCTDGYGYSGVSVGYGNGYAPGYGASAYGSPYWGWYDGYYYPGTGYYVYDRDRRPHRWNDGQRRYWSERQRGWQGPRGDRNGDWSGFPQRDDRGRDMRRDRDRDRDHDWRGHSPDRGREWNDGRRGADRNLAPRNGAAQRERSRAGR